MEVKLENLPGLTSSTKPHSAEWTPWSAKLTVQQSMMVYSVGFGFGFWFWFFGFRFLMFIIRFWFSLYNLKAKTKTEK